MNQLAIEIANFILNKQEHTTVDDVFNNFLGDITPISQTGMKTQSYSDVFFALFELLRKGNIVIDYKTSYLIHSDDVPVIETPSK